MKYQILSGEQLDPTEYDAIDEAVRAACSSGAEFKIVVVREVEWKIVESRIEASRIGYGTITDTVRQAVPPEGANAARVLSIVREKDPSAQITGSQIHSSLKILARRGELQRVARGVYKPIVERSA